MLVPFFLMFFHGFKEGHNLFLESLDGGLLMGFEFIIFIFFLDEAGIFLLIILGDLLISKRFLLFKDSHFSMILHLAP